MTDKILDISELELDSRNARGETERSNYVLRSSLEKYGPLRSLVGQRLPDGTIKIRAGNHTLAQAGQMGIDKVRLVERNPKELVVVVADDLDEEAWTKYGVIDNVSSDLAGWEETILADIHDKHDLGDIFYKEEIDDWERATELDTALETLAELGAGMSRGDGRATEQIYAAEPSDRSPQPPTPNLSWAGTQDDTGQGHSLAGGEGNGAATTTTYHTYPLAIVLSSGEMKQWKEIKDSYGVKSDRQGFLMLMGEKAVGKPKER